MENIKNDLSSKNLKRTFQTKCTIASLCLQFLLLGPQENLQRIRGKDAPISIALGSNIHNKVLVLLEYLDWNECQWSLLLLIREKYCVISDVFMTLMPKTS